MSRLKCTRGRITAWPRFALLALALIAVAVGGFGAEPAAPLAPVGKTDETNTQDMLRAYLQVQEQFHATQLSIERNRKEAAGCKRLSKPWPCNGRRIWMPH